MVYEIGLFTRLCVEPVCVGHIVNLCITHSGIMHLTWTCEMCGPWIVHRILHSLRMATVACYLLWDVWSLNCPSYFTQPENGNLCLCVSSICNFVSVNMLFSDTPISGVWSENNGVMLPKSRLEDTHTRQTPNNMRRSLFLGGLGHILPNRV
jgi:hypothetical protein